MNNEYRSTWLERPVHPALPSITNEIAIFAGIVLLAVITRFYDLESRVMSHDESLHTYFSWLLYRGQGYQHTPMMHGPLQFHMLALTYFIFGVSDLTARIPAVLFSIATVWMVWSWRDYLGRWGAIVAGLLLVVSPYMLYYGRYVRNESFTGVAGLLLLYGILRYLEKGQSRYLYFVTAGSLLHFTTKETAFIYAAQAMLFLGFYFIARVTRRPWQDNPGLYRAFIIALAVTAVLATLGVGIGYATGHPETITSGETAAPANPTGGPNPLALPEQGIQPASILLGLAAIIFVAAVVILFLGFGWRNLLQER
ncbi:MAG TPA: flippase activity-associated protein Agl23, partial [Anaerolineales bacterium]|nr:flippase activity-associated protein Agl23 [Anaerolineales bacterium]